MNDKQVLKDKKKLLPGSGMSYHQFKQPHNKILQLFDTPLKLDSLVEFSTNEMTALCPLTGFPDQYEVHVTYMPKLWCVESKSAKHYFGAFRNYKGFIEKVAQKIFDDWYIVTLPKYLEVKIKMNPRGGVAIETVISKEFN